MPFLAPFRRFETSEYVQKTPKINNLSRNAYWAGIGDVHLRPAQLLVICWYAVLSPRGDANMTLTDLTKNRALLPRTALVAPKGPSPSP